MVLVDTNVLFSFLVENDWSERARALFSNDASWHTESHALVELSNVVTRYVRNNLMTDAEARKALALAEQILEPRIHAVAHVDAFAAACKHRVSAYDARFLVAARVLGVKLVTEDAKLRHAAPTLTQSLDDALVRS